MTGDSLPLRRLIAAHASSAAGDAAVAVALAGTLFFNVSVDEARPKLALYLFLTMAPFSVLAPLVGPAIQRIRGGVRAGMVLAGAGRAGLAIWMASAHGSLWLYPAAFGVLVLARAHGVARTTLVPVAAADEHSLVSANARLARAAVLAGAAAAVPAAILARLIGPDPALVLAACAYALAGTAAAALPPTGRSRDAGGRGRADLPARARPAFVANAAVRGLGGFLLFLLAFGLKRRGVGEAGFAVVLAASGFGSLAGSTIVSRVARPGNESALIAGSLLFGAGVSLVAARSFGTDLAALVGGVLGAITNAARVAFDSLMQSDLPAEGRVAAFARAETGLQAAWVAGALIPVVVPFALEPGLVLASVGFLVAAGWYAVNVHRTVDKPDA